MNGIEQGHFNRRSTPRGTHGLNPNLTKGFSIFDLMVSLLMTAVLVGAAIPYYEDAIAKRELINGAEQIVTFVRTIQGESVKRNRMIAVSYSTLEDGRWCIAGVLGRTPCNCMETDHEESGFCNVDPIGWILRDTDISAKNLIDSVFGDGAFVFDPVRGIFLDPRDSLTLALRSEPGRHRMKLNMISTGRLSLCQTSPDQRITGIKSCSPNL